MFLYRLYKIIIETFILRFGENQWTTRINAHSDCTMFEAIYPKLYQSSIWSVARARPESLQLMKLLACLCCQRAPGLPTVCRHFGQPNTWELYHIMFDRTSSNNRQHNFLLSEQRTGIVSAVI